MEYRVLKDFKGSPDGRFAVDYKKDEIVPLTASLAEVALAEKWVELVKAGEPEAKTPKGKKGAVPPAPTSDGDTTETTAGN